LERSLAGATINVGGDLVTTNAKEQQSLISRREMRDEGESLDLQKGDDS
jgi:hypothetical protein